MICFNKEQFFIVAGASSGIGEGVALLLNELGASVVGIGRNQERLEAMKAKAKNPENIHLEQKDLTEDIEGLPAYVKSLKDKYGKFQGMAYCAGIANPLSLQAMDFSETRKMFDINYFAPVFMVKGFADRRINNGRGSSVVMIASTAATYPDKGQTAYAGTKAGLKASMKAVSKELSSQGIRVNTVSPAMVNTPMAGIVNEIPAEYPFGYGDVCDVASTVVFLLSDKAAKTTGEDYLMTFGAL